MARFKVTGGKKLKGEISLSGNKNSALKLIPAALLTDEDVFLTNVPKISDVDVMLEIIKSLGAKVEHSGHDVKINAGSLKSYIPDPVLCSRIRASVVLAAPLLVRFGKAVVTPPGGDQIGDRLLDTHFSMMQKMGVEMVRKDGQFHLSWKKNINDPIFLEEASVTATEMGLMMGSSLKQAISIDDVAMEPHIRDLSQMLSKMGAKISGTGTNSIVVSGGVLKGVTHAVIPDHIEGGTFAIAAAITGGEITIKNIIPEDYRMILHYLTSMGVSYTLGDDTLKIMPSKLQAVRRKFQTRPWPGFPTDLMSPFIVLATQTQGTVLCHDWMYEWRMFFVDDLISMGANIFIADPHRVIISGPTKLMADRLFCKDIRAGISVILAAMVAEGESIIENAEIVRRGYEDIDKRLNDLGASIKEE